jgi:hypothetical protein
MATIVVYANSRGFNTNAGDKVFTPALSGPQPAVGDLVAIVVPHSGTAAWDSPFDNNPDGLGTYSLIGSIATMSTGGIVSQAIYVRNALLGVAVQTTFTAPAPVSPVDTGGGITVLKITGMSRAGLAAVKQFKINVPASGGAASSGVWDIARLATNPTLVALFANTVNANPSTPPSTYTMLFNGVYNTPTCYDSIISRDASVAGTTAISWPGITMTGTVVSVEFDTAPVPFILDLDPANFKMTGVPAAIAPKVAMTFSPPLLKLTPTTIQLLRKLSFQVSIFDFGRPSIQFAIRNTLDTADFKFLPSAAISVGELWSLDSTTMDFVANDIEMATLVELESTSFDFFTSDLDLVAGPSLDVAIFDFVGQSMLIGSQIALDPAEFNFSGAEVSAAKTITLDVEADGLEFTTLPIDAKNRPPGTVLDLIPGLFNFVPNPLGIKTTVSLDVAHFDFIPAPTGTTSFVKVTLDATTFDFDPTEVNPVAEPVIILLTTADFKFTARLLQLTGISSAGDRKRMLMGVGR